MEQSSRSNDLVAFDLLRAAAREYNNSEYKFYTHGFFKFKREGDATFLIEDIYITPEFRGTPVAHMILSDFEDYMRYEKVLMYYGRVFKATWKFKKRLETFKKWGMTEVLDNNESFYVTVSKQVEY